MNAEQLLFNRDTDSSWEIRHCMTPFFLALFYLENSHNIIHFGRHTLFRYFTLATVGANCCLGYYHSKLLTLILTAREIYLEHQDNGQ